METVDHVYRGRAYRIASAIREFSTVRPMEHASQHCIDCRRLIDLGARYVQRTVTAVCIRCSVRESLLVPMTTSIDRPARSPHAAIRRAEQEEYATSSDSASASDDRTDRPAGDARCRPGTPSTDTEIAGR